MDVSQANRDERAKIAYKCAMDLFAAQDRSVSNLRTRATGIFATSAFVVTFASSIGLVGNDKTKGLVFPHWAAISLFVIILIQGLCVMIVIWPVEMIYGHSAYKVVNPPDDEANRSPIDRAFVEGLVGDLKINKSKILRMSRCFRVAICLLMAEVSIVLAVVASAP
ncbi:hypothetical protein [Streptomyces virginiae]|uniref:hypothetical protein n=1 Tax=Streptomyces virginiae TaxID=1961 RepID=UPI0033224ADF